MFQLVSPRRLQKILHEVLHAPGNVWSGTGHGVRFLIVLAFQPRLTGEQIVYWFWWKRKMTAGHSYTVADAIRCIESEITKAKTENGFRECKSTPAVPRGKPRKAEGQSAN